jgi:hypothetical protein
MLAFVAWGWMTATEAARRMRMHPETVRRLCRDCFDRGPASSRRAYADALERKAEGYGRRDLVAHQMRQAIEAYEARQNTTPDTKSDTDA